MSCCSGSGEILIVPREEKLSEHEEGVEDRAPLPSSVLSSFEEFVATMEEDGQHQLHARLRSLRSTPYVAVVDENQVEQELGRLRKDSRVRCATRNWRISPSMITRDDPDGEVTRMSQETARAVRTSMAAREFLWESGLTCWSGGRSGSERVTVGILDTGLDPAFVEWAKVDPVQIEADSWTAVAGPPFDPHGHGSIIAAIIDEIVGDSVHLVPIRCLGHNGGTLSSVVYGLLLARLTRNIDVFNMSFSVDFSVDHCPSCGHTFNSQDERAAMASLFEYLRTELDDRPILVAAAGNAGSVVALPASLPGVIAVGSTGATPLSSPAPDPSYVEVPADFVLAPGGSNVRPIAPAIRAAASVPFYGTSFATAVVTGVIAAMLSDPIGYNEIPYAPDETRRAAVVEALRLKALRDFPAYDPAVHGIGVLLNSINRDWPRHEAAERVTSGL